MSGSRCRSCGQPIKWIKLQGSGKAIPVDPMKRILVPGQGTEVLITDDGRVVRGRFASMEEGAAECGYISHFATCPQADKWRRK